MDKKQNSIKLLADMSLPIYDPISDCFANDKFKAGSLFRFRKSGDNYILWNGDVSIDQYFKENNRGTEWEFTEEYATF